MLRRLILERLLNNCYAVHVSLEYQRGQGHPHFYHRPAIEILDRAINYLILQLRD